MNNPYVFAVIYCQTVQFQLQDFDRQIVKSEYATVLIPVIEFEQPPSKRGGICTVFLDVVAVYMPDGSLLDFPALINYFFLVFASNYVTVGTIGCCVLNCLLSNCAIYVVILSVYGIPAFSIQELFVPTMTVNCSIVLQCMWYISHNRQMYGIIVSLKKQFYTIQLYSKAAYWYVY